MVDEEEESAALSLPTPRFLPADLGREPRDFHTHNHLFIVSYRVKFEGFSVNNRDWSSSPTGRLLHVLPEEGPTWWGTWVTPDTNCSLCSSPRWKTLQVTPHLLSSTKNPPPSPNYNAALVILILTFKTVKDFLFSLSLVLHITLSTFSQIISYIAERIPNRYKYI